MGRKSQKKLLQFIDSLVATGVRELAGHIVKADGTPDEDRARERMMAIAQSICFQYAKAILYVPVDMEVRLSKRDDEIWAEYGQDGPDGARKYSPDRVNQLSVQHGLTVSHIYCIARLMLKRELESRKGRLSFAADPPTAPV